MNNGIIDSIIKQVIRAFNVLRPEDCFVNSLVMQWIDEAAMTSVGELWQDNSLNYWSKTQYWAVDKDGRCWELEGSVMDDGNIVYHAKQNQDQIMELGIEPSYMIKLFGEYRSDAVDVTIYAAKAA